MARGLVRLQRHCHVLELHIVSGLATLKVRVEDIPLGAIVKRLDAD